MRAQPAREPETHSHHPTPAAVMNPSERGEAYIDIMRDLAEASDDGDLTNHHHAEIGRIIRPFGQMSAPDLNEVLEGIHIALSTLLSELIRGVAAPHRSTLRGPPPAPAASRTGARRHTKADDGARIGTRYGAHLLAAQQAAREGKALALRSHLDSLNEAHALIEAMPPDHHLTVLDSIDDLMHAVLDPTAPAESPTPSRAPGYGLGVHFATHLNRTLSLLADPAQTNHTKTGDHLRCVQTIGHELVRSGSPDHYREFIEAILAEAEHQLDLKSSCTLSRPVG